MVILIISSALLSYFKQLLYHITPHLIPHIRQLLSRMWLVQLHSVVRWTICLLGCLPRARTQKHDWYAIMYVHTHKHNAVASLSTALLIYML